MKYIKPTVELFSDMPAAGGCGNAYGQCQAMSCYKTGFGCGNAYGQCQQQSCYQ